MIGIFFKVVVFAVAFVAYIAADVLQTFLIFPLSLLVEGVKKVGSLIANN